ncbi:MAG: hypothetical protein NTW19_07405 [Planctomycetota bacterium]|nr:hypothetical protein [Planctomycetota bacterium]
MPTYTIPDKPGRFAVVGNESDGFCVANNVTKTTKRLSIYCRGFDEALVICEQLNRGDHDGTIHIPDETSSFAVRGDLKRGFYVCVNDEAQKRVLPRFRSYEEAMEVCDRLNRDENAVFEFPDIDIPKRPWPAKPSKPKPALTPPATKRHPRVLYVEQKTDGNRNLADRGPAEICEVTASKTGSTIYYKGKSLQRIRGIYGNYRCVEDGNEYWVSGPKTRGSNRHWAGGGPVGDATNKG